MACTCDMNGRGGMHCRGCCLTLTGLTAFDKHQRGGVCADPADCGLVESRPGVWGFPIDDDSRERLRSLRAERTPAHSPVTPQDFGAAEFDLEPS